MLALGVLQTNTEPKAKACSGEACHVGEHERIDFSLGVETSGYTTDSHLDLRVQCENQKLYI